MLILMVAMGTNKQTQATSKLEPQLFLRITSPNALGRALQKHEAVGVFVATGSAEAPSKRPQLKGVTTPHPLHAHVSMHTKAKLTEGQRRNKQELLFCLVCHLKNPDFLG